MEEKQLEDLGMTKDEVTFEGLSKNTGEVVSGYFFENLGKCYITEMDEDIQPPIKRMHQVVAGSIKLKRIVEVV